MQTNLAGYVPNGDFYSEYYLKNSTSFNREMTNLFCYPNIDTMFNLLLPFWAVTLHKPASGGVYT